MRVLLSAYACEPNKGSEPGLGWNWALHLAKYCDVTVVTRSNNRFSIEEEFYSHPQWPKIRWIYHDLNNKLVAIKRYTKLHRLYYHFWQRSLIPLVNRLCFECPFDIIHHLTYASYRYQTGITMAPCKKVWGPIGGVEYTPWHLLPHNHFPTVIHEGVRNLQNTFSGKQNYFDQYDHILTCTRETQDFFAKRGKDVALLPSIGLHKDQLRKVMRNRNSSHLLRLLFVGSLQHLKGIHFMIEAMQYVDVPLHFTIVGKGEYEHALRRRVSKLSLNHAVTFTGYIPQNRLHTLHDTHDIFVFPSLHDSGGFALLEAMGTGMPSITLNCGGPAVIVDETCGFRIPVTTRSKIVEGIVDAIKTYIQKPELLQKHGQAAYERASKEFLWDDKAKTMIKLYDDLLKKK